MQRFALYFKHFYRPQRSWDKVMFLQVSVILFTKGRWWYSSMHCRWYPSMPCSRSPRGRGVVSQHVFQVSRLIPRGEVEGSGLGGSPGPHLGGLQAHTGGGLQAHTQWGACIPACTEVDPPNGYCCRRYASYWNAFLYTMLLCKAPNW